MSYRMDYGALDNIMNVYNTVIAEWSNGISSVLTKKGAIAESTNISGNKADGMKTYLKTVYSYAGDSLGKLLKMFQNSFLLYIDEYHQRIDSDRSTHIEENL